MAYTKGIFVTGMITEAPSCTDNSLWLRLTAADGTVYTISVMDFPNQNILRNVLKIGVTITVMGKADVSSPENILATTFHFEQNYENRSV